MNSAATVRYFGWSALSVTANQRTLFFDPFYRDYCGAQWFSGKDFVEADYIAITHGHEEHFLDTPELAKFTGARVIGSHAVTRFLERRHKLPASQLLTLGPGQSGEVEGFKIDTFNWQHRDINLYASVTRSLLRGNATQLAWAWSSATKAPFYAPYTGYVLTLPDHLTVMNYNEGFNSKMTDQEITELGKRHQVDVLLGGMQLDFVEDLRRGIAALRPKSLILLYPPHEKLHDMMGAASRPWSEFAAAAQAAAPQATVILLTPGMEVDLHSGAVTSFEPRLRRAA